MLLIQKRVLEMQRLSSNSINTLNYFYIKHNYRLIIIVSLSLTFLLVSCITNLARMA